VLGASFVNHKDGTPELLLQTGKLTRRAQQALEIGKTMFSLTASRDVNHLLVNEAQVTVSSPSQCTPSAHPSALVGTSLFRVVCKPASLVYHELLNRVVALHHPPAVLCESTFLCDATGANKEQGPGV
jgi:hypothetical protein